MRIIVKSIDQMPGEARGGIPLGCVLETDGPTVIAYGKGGTFSAAGLDIVDASLRTYVAYFGDDFASSFDAPVSVQAIDIQAALMWLREHHHGSFSLFVEAASSYLGEFNQDGGPA